jgi:hypothetical protein
MIDCNLVFIIIVLYITLYNVFKIIGIQISELNNGVLLILDDNVNGGVPMVIRMKENTI